MSDILAIDLIKALYIDAGQEQDEERAAQLRRDATALEDIWSRTKYALAPTRDQMTAALGNASLNIADTLSAVAQRTSQMDNRVGEIHQHVQDNNTLISAFLQSNQAFQAEARAAWEGTARGLGKLETDIGELRADNERLHDGQSAILSRVDAVEEALNQTELNALRRYEENAGRIEAVELLFKEYTAGNRRAELVQLREEVRSLKEEQAAIRAEIKRLAAERSDGSS